MYTEHWTLMHAEPAAGGGAVDDPAITADDAGKQPPKDDAGKDDAGKQPPKTSVEDTSAGEDDAPAATWPDDWREKLASGDEALAKRLQRFASPKAVWESYQQLEKKLSSGQKRSPHPGEDATPEELAAWRAEVGVPEKTDEYYKHLQGIAIGDEDRPLVDEFLGVAQETGLPAEQVKPMLDWYFQQAEATRAAREEQDSEVAAATTRELREEWGGDFKGNMTAVRNLLDLAPEDVRDTMYAARAEDGTPLMSHPGALRFLRTLAGEAFPAGTLVPDGNMNDLKPVEARIHEIETMMRTNRKAYNANTQVQEELRALYTARDKLRSRSK